jgi:hypothetical protein
MPSDLLRRREWQVLFSQVSDSRRLPLVGPETCATHDEFQHILLLTTTGLLMEGVMLRISIASDSCACSQDSDQL